MDFSHFRTCRSMGHHSSIIAGLFLACFAMGSWQVRESDPELITDFAVPGGIIVTMLNGNSVTSTALSNDPAKAESFASVSPMDFGSFRTARQGVAVSFALLQVLLVLVRLVLAAKRFFTQTLEAGDLFVFSKGIVHFQMHWRKDHVRATALRGFSSSIPGLLHLASALFQPKIPNKLLAKAFGVSASLEKQPKAATVSSCRKPLFGLGLWDPCTPPCIFLEIRLS